MNEDKFTLHEDGLDRIILWCNVCQEQIILEDVLTFRYLLSRTFGKLQATIYTLHNVLRMNSFVRGHQHKEEN